ncbi:MAG TPA: hypothetical protein VIE66_21335 [Methylocella sp.]|jgi:mercuric ion transport protein
MLRPATRPVQPSASAARGSATSQRLAPYQPYFIAATLACLGYGYWLVYRGRKLACAEGAVCARPLPNHIVISGLVVATLLVGGAIGLDLLAPYFLSP